MKYFLMAPEPEGGGGGGEPVAEPKQDLSFLEPDPDPAGEAQVAEAPQTTFEGVDNPDKYQGKSIDEIAAMHANAEKLIGEKSTKYQRAMETVEQLTAQLTEVRRQDETAEEETTLGTMPDPANDPENFQRWLEARDSQLLGQVKSEMSEEQAVRETEKQWSKAQVDNSWADADVEKIKQFWSNPANLSPEFLHKAMNVDTLVDQARQGVTSSMTNAIGRTQGAPPTTSAAAGGTVDNVDSSDAALAKAQEFINLGQTEKAETILSKWYADNGMNAKIDL